MARGWESKSVEAQQAAAADTRSKPPKVTAEESARRAEQAIAELDSAWRRLNIPSPKPQAPNPNNSQPIGIWNLGFEIWDLLNGVQSGLHELLVVGGR